MFLPADDQWLQLDPVAHPLLEGHWQAEAELVKLDQREPFEEPDRQMLARVGIEGGWHLVKAAGADEAEHGEL